MGTFDPNVFLDAQVQGAFSTEFKAVPEGTYTAVLGEPKIEQWQARDGSKSGYKLTLRCRIDDPALQEELGRVPTVRADFMLDMNEAGTALDYGPGKNINLGRLREAVGMNDASKPFNFRMLDGQVVKCKVTQRVHEGEIYNDVKSFAKAV